MFDDDCRYAVPDHQNALTDQVAVFSGSPPRSGAVGEALGGDDVCVVPEAVVVSHVISSLESQNRSLDPRVENPG